MPGKAACEVPLGVIIKDLASSGNRLKRFSGSPCFSLCRSGKIPEGKKVDQRGLSGHRAPEIANREPLHLARASDVVCGTVVFMLKASWEAIAYLNPVYSAIHVFVGSSR